MQDVGQSQVQYLNDCFKIKIQHTTVVKRNIKCPAISVSNLFLCTLCLLNGSYSFLSRCVFLTDNT